MLVEHHVEIDLALVGWIAGKGQAIKPPRLHGINR